MLIAAITYWVPHMYAFHVAWEMPSAYPVLIMDTISVQHCSLHGPPRAKLIHCWRLPALISSNARSDPHAQVQKGASLTLYTLWQCNHSFMEFIAFTYVTWFRCRTIGY